MVITLMHKLTAVIAFIGRWKLKVDGLVYAGGAVQGAAIKDEVVMREKNG